MDGPDVLILELVSSLDIKLIFVNCFAIIAVECI